MWRYLSKDCILKHVVNTVRKINYLYPNQYFNFLDDRTLLTCSTLSNGLTVVTEERDSPFSCIGIFIDAGSRYETCQDNGSMHFFEHICFKGSQKRSKLTLEKDMSETGAKFKCFTTREMIGFYAECLNDTVPTVVDIMSDCVFSNMFGSSEVELQKHLVYREMTEHDNDYKDVVFDYLHKAAFQGTSLSNSVIGPSHNLYHFNPSNLSIYIQKMFVTSRITFVGVGGINHQQMENLGDMYLSRNQTSTCTGSGPYRFTGSEIIYRNDSMGVAHVALAVEAPPFNHEDRLTLELASAVVGNWDRSQGGGVNNSSNLGYYAAGSGFSSHFESFYIAYRDAGLWGAYFVVSPMHVDDMVVTVQTEWMKLCTMLTDTELRRAKMQLKSNILAKNQTSAGACLDIAKWAFYNDCIPTIRNQFNDLDKISADKVKTVCSNYIYDKCPAVAAVGTTECLPSYPRTRAGMYRLRL